MQKLFKIRYAALSASLALLSVTVFYFVDDIFNPLFTVSLTCAVGGLILTGLLLSVALVKSPRRWRRLLGYLSSFVLLLVSAAVVIAAVDYRFFFFYHKMSHDDWRQDLKYLAENIEKVHPKPFSKIQQEDFQREVTSLDQQIPNLNDEQIAMRMIRLVALIGDGHTTSFPFQPAVDSKMYPLQLYHFSDGLYVTDASDKYKQLIGQRVLKIGDTPVEQVYEILKPFIAADNEQAVLERIPLYYVCAGALQSQGIVKSASEARWSFADDAGTQSEVTLEPVSVVTYFYWYIKPLRSWKYKPAPNPLTPLYLREDSSNDYWFTYLEPSKAVYVQINQFLNKRDESITKFGKRLVEFANTHAVNRVVIDIRRNSGGDNTIYHHFIDDISQSPVINQRGRLYTLIGRTTFSAAVNFTTEFEQKTNTLFVGEPTSAGPNHYGDAQFFKLPRSKIVLFISTRRWQLSNAQDTRAAHEPQMGVKLTHQDYFSNRDPVLEAALRYQPTEAVDAKTH